MKNLLGIGILESKEATFSEEIAMIKDAGFDATMLGWTSDADMAEKVDIARKAGLYVDNFHAPFGGLNCIWLDGEDGERYLEMLMNCVSDAAKLDVPIVVVHCTAGANPSEPRGTVTGIERFSRLIAHAKKLGVKLAFENLEYPEMLGLIMDVFKDEDLGFCYDTGHEALCTPGMRFMPLYGDKLCCTHIHDNYGASYTRVPIVHGDCHMIPFDCNLDFYRIMDDIRSANYEGVLMLESGLNRENGYYYDLTLREYYERAFEAIKKLSEL